MKRKTIVAWTAVLALAACGGAEEAADEPMPAEEPQQIVLGPVDGHDLPGTDTARVQVGQEAPDFTLEALGQEPVTLSAFRGDKNVVLAFYRGHW